MGLYVDFDCWQGPYSAFHRWRIAVAYAADIELNAMEGFTHPGLLWETIDDPITILLNHSDCGGKIKKKHLIPLADRLEELLPKLDQGEEPWAHLSPRGRAVQFIKGLRAAAAAGKPVRFS